MKKFFYLIISLFLLQPITSHAQEESQEEYNPYADVLPPSPNAASLGQYGDIPVNLSTGTPGISFPLASIAGDYLSIPITLSYQSSGRGVNEIASFVGLGWSLDAGGVITRTKRGLVDEGPGGFLSLCPTYGICNTDDIEHDFDVLEDIAMGEKDSKPDIFHYNISGASGKFVFDWNGDARAVPHNNMKIDFVGTTNPVITLTTPEGIEYEFDERERSFSESYCNDGVTLDGITAWYLTKVTHPNGEQITIDYIFEPSGTGYVQSINEVKNVIRENSIPSSECLSALPLNYIQKCSLIVYNQQMRVNEITSKYFKAKFNYQGRVDVPGGKAVDSIEIFSSDGTTKLKEIDFAYDYHTSGQTGEDIVTKRLKLLSVQEKNGADVKAPYQFTYLDDVNPGKYSLPNRLSNKQDFWGYRNSNPVDQLIPSWDHINLLDGADRYPDVEKAKSAMLYQIEYPTGGTTQFEYELNEYSSQLREHHIEIPFKSTTTIESEAFLKVEGTNDYQFLEFDIYENQDVQMTTTITNKIACDPNEPEYGNATAYFNLTYTSPLGGGTSTVELPKQICNTMVFGYNLRPGHYKLEGFTLDGPNSQHDYGDISFTYLTDQIASPSDRTYLGPGLRVKKVITSDGIRSLTKSYDYSDPDNTSRSSGILLKVPNHVYDVNVRKHQGQIECGSPCPYFSRALGQAPLGAVEGAAIMYTSVVETIGTVGEFGRIEHAFTFDGDGGSPLAYPYGTPLTSDAWRRGQENETEVYDAASVLVQKGNQNIDFQDSPSGTNNVKIAVIDVAFEYENYACEGNEGIIDFIVHLYHHESYWIRNLSSTSTFYDPLGVSSVTVTNTNTYDPVYLNVLSQTTTTGGQSQTTQFKYAEELDHTDMIDKHMVSIPLEIKNSGIKTSGTKIDYELSPTGCSGCILPTKVFSWNWKDGGWETTPEVEVKKFNDDGFPKKIVRRGMESGNCEDGSEHAEVLEWGSDNLLDSWTFEGRTKSYTYFPASRQMKTFTDIDGQSISYNYDKLQRLDEISERGGLKTASIDYNYLPIDGVNSVVKDYNFDGENYQLQDKTVYDGLGKQKYGYSKGHLFSSVAYDALGRVTSQKDFTNSYTVQNQYYASPGGTIKSSGVIGWPEGQEMTYWFESNNRVEELTDENGQKFENHTDMFGRKLKDVKYLDSNPVVTEYQYDQGGNVQTIIPPDGPSYTFSYDGRNRLGSKTIPNQGTHTYTYNCRDLVEIQKSPGYGDKEFIYTVFGEIDDVKIDGQLAIDNTWGTSGINTGRLESKDVRVYGPDGNNEWVSYVNTYDGFGRLFTESVTNPFGSGDGFFYTYDNADFVESVRREHTYAGSSASLDMEDVLTYDQYGRNTSVTQEIAGQVQKINTKVYNDIDQITNKYLGQNGAGFGYLKEVFYKYNVRDWLTQINQIDECKTDFFFSPAYLENGEEGFEQETEITVQYNDTEWMEGVPTLVQVELEVDFIIEEAVIDTYTESITFGEHGQGASPNYTETINLNISGIVDPDVATTLILDEWISEAVRFPNPYITKEQDPDRIRLGDRIRDVIEEIPREEKCLGPDDLFAEYITYIESDQSIGAEDQYTGNISQIDWVIYGVDEKSSYTYKYDDLSRLVKSKFYIDDNGSQDRFGTDYVYHDLLGNIEQITRSGWLGQQGQQDIWGIMDDLTFTFNECQISTITESGNQNYGFLGSGGGVTYEDGNVVASSAQGILDIDYNEINMPEQFTTNQSIIKCWYDAEGTKWKQQIISTVGQGPGAPSPEVRDYRRGIEYKNGGLEVIYNEDGRAVFVEGLDRYEYIIRDHLGNTRVVFTDLNEDGLIDLNQAAKEVRNGYNYYPFGYGIEYMDYEGQTFTYNYQYNEKENVGAGLNWLDYGARWYDPVIGRFNGVDPLADKYPWISGYAAFNNNPIFYVDPDGRENIPALIWAAKNMANKGISSNYGNPYFADDDNRWTYKIGTVPDRTVCYESCFIAYMNSGESVLPTLRTGFTNKNNAFYGRSTTTGGMNWFKAGDGTDRQFVTNITKGELGDIVFMGEVGDMQGHAVLLAGDITMGTTEIDGKSYETATFYTLSTSSDTESESYGGREFTFTKQSDGTWQQQGGAGYTFNGFGQMTNVNATDEQRQEATKLIEDME